MSMEVILDPLKDQMLEVEERIYSDLSPADKRLSDLVYHISKLQGKRLRPALLLLSGQCSGGLIPQHIDLAVVVELIHTATLVHDDIIDEAVVRRHIETMNMKWGSKISILFGDYLFSRAYTILSALDSQVSTLIMSQTINILCEGEMVQLLRCYDTEVTESEYLSIIERKTASLCAASCKLGAISSGANKWETEALTNYGSKIGMAFQIIDDCLDVMGKEEEMGKPVNLDAQIGKLTLPFIRLVDKLPTDHRESTLELIFQNSSKDSKAAIADLLAEHDAVDYAYDTAKRLIKDAQENLSVIPDSVYKTSLLELGDYVVSRDR